MMKVKFLALLQICLLVASCGPDTIFMRPGLDTPEQHVAAGNLLLERGKVEDACREFTRAKELDPQFVKAYVGMGVALGLKGDLDGGVKTMDRASQIAAKPEDLQEVRKGYEQLDAIRRKQIK